MNNKRPIKKTQNNNQNSVVMLNKNELENIVDKYEYLHTLLKTDISVFIENQEKLKDLDSNVSEVGAKLMAVNHVLSNSSKTLSEQAVKEIENNLQYSIINTIKNYFINNKDLTINVKRICKDNIDLKRLLENQNATEYKYKKLISFKSNIFSFLFGMLFISSFVFLFFTSIKNSFIIDDVSLLNKKNKEFYEYLIANDFLFERINDKSYISFPKDSKLTQENIYEDRFSISIKD